MAFLIEMGYNKAMAATLTKKQLSKAIQMEAGKPINDSSFFARLKKKTESGELVRIGKGVYAKSNLPVFDYELFSQAAKDVHVFLMGEYLGRIEFAVYEVTILNRFLNHLIAGSTTIVDVPKGFCENIFYALQDRGFRNVLLNPTEDENYRYNHNDGETIIVKGTSSRSPIDRKMGKVLLEKLLVDIVSDKRLRYFFEGAETGPAVEEIVTSYSLDYAKVRTYAKRRGCYEKLLQYIPEEVRRKYL